MVATRPAWMRPRAIFCPATMITPVLLARRCTVTGPVDGRGGGPAGAGAPEPAGLVQVSGLGRVRILFEVGAVFLLSWRSRGAVAGAGESS